MQPTIGTFALLEYAHYKPPIRYDDLALHGLKSEKFNNARGFTGDDS